MTKFNDRIGEVNIATNRQKMTIIDYRDSHDIDVQFEDGTIVKNRTYVCFKNGNIRNPNKPPIIYRNSKNKDKRIGEISISKIGQKMTIIAYRNCDNIDIQFEDGTIVINKTYNNFKNGTIKHPNNYSKASERIGETNISVIGQTMTIIAYRNVNDIDIQFEDGTVVTNKSYQNFKKGTIKHPKINKIFTSHRIGETRKAKNGQLMTIINYRNAKDFDVQFDDGTIVTNMTYQSFKKGEIRNPNNIIRSKPPIHYHKIGECTKATNGQMMTIIEYRNANDIDIQFEDGTIVKNQYYSCFKKGCVKNPNKLSIGYVSEFNDRTGETNIAKNGQKMTIIAYRNSMDIDVQFEDGTIVKNRTYQSFKRREIENPNKKIRLKNNVGDIIIAKNGLKMTIIEYRSSNDISVQFEDGCIVNTTCSNLYGKSVKHPFPYQMDNILLKKKAYVDKNTGIGYFICICNKCGYRDIWTIENAKNHKCEEIKK